MDNSSEKFLGTPRIEPGAYGWEVLVLPLSYATPTKYNWFASRTRAEPCCLYNLKTGERKAQGDLPCIGIHETQENKVIKPILILYCRDRTRYSGAMFSLSSCSIQSLTELPVSVGEWELYQSLLLDQFFRLSQPLQKSDRFPPKTVSGLCIYWSGKYNSIEATFTKLCTLAASCWRPAAGWSFRTVGRWPSARSRRGRRRCCRSSSSSACWSKTGWPSTRWWDPDSIEYFSFPIPWILCSH